MSRDGAEGEEATRKVMGFLKELLGLLKKADQCEKI